ncbi:hypothetical protein [Pseudovibrio sp. Tun.PSC04-5.I4]|uniref:hypothetical protein n=1 Tax=Pseudovibrio sp. Tun.PSC04-5.I4 TaxID=1798213 RepID=UPI00088B37C3|nr:hypothetical protein [Pseudovibrio sp. Tun.PSC04-5.I4]SDR37006.1 hypothetical protein SAMN04515695_5040 [Pseudovibrio sp. Tun.PSC04-5.I4]
MEITAQRPTLLHQSLTSQVAPAKAETEQVQTELSGARAVTASAETTDNQTATNKPFKSDSRTGDPQKTEQATLDQARLVRQYNYDEDSKELIYSLTQEPEGDVIYELPSKTARRIRAFVDEVIQLQEKRNLGGEAKEVDPAAYETKQTQPTQAEQERAA